MDRPSSPTPTPATSPWTSSRPTSARLAANAAAHGRDRAAGPPREGPALLQGIIICGTLRRADDRPLPPPPRPGSCPTYVCQRDGIDNAAPDLPAAIPGAGLDAAHRRSCCIDTLTPLAIEAALTVTAELEHRAAEADALRAAHVERARYHADLARRRYLAVDPANRLVADTLEADWNTALRALSRRPGRLRHRPASSDTGQLTDAQKTRIRAAGHRPARASGTTPPPRRGNANASPGCCSPTSPSPATGDTITAHVRLPGGQHHTLTLPVPRTAWRASARPPPASSPPSTSCSTDHTHAEIADILNQPRPDQRRRQPFHRIIVRHHPHLPAAQPPPAPPRRRPAHPQPRWPPCSACPARTPSRPGTTPESSAASAITTKAKSLYHPPDPENPIQPPKIGRPPKRTGQPEHETPRASTR